MRMILVLLFMAWGPGAFAGSLHEEQEFARSILHGLQEASIRSNREYCGLIGRDALGRLIATEAVRGTRARCRYPDPPPGTVVVASFHTHGAFLRNYDNEVPSVLDVMSEAASRTRGYISTPGGRFWMVDGRTGVSRLLCDARCLPWDPRYQPGLGGAVASKYSIDDLRRRQTR